jgi:DNA polymerase-3 subunit epsilon
MIVFDTETTGFLKPEVADLAAQPSIIELAMVKLGPGYEELDRYEALINPGVLIDEELHKRITGLTNADLADKPTFLELVDELAEFCLGERTLVAHNLGFDLGMLRVELLRIGRECAFPYPPQGICTVERTQHLKGHRLKLVDLYELKLGRKLKQTHRAMGDVQALVEVVKALEL